MIPLGSIVSVAEPFARAAGIPLRSGQLLSYEPGVRTTLARIAIDGIVVQVPVGEVEAAR